MRNAPKAEKPAGAECRKLNANKLPARPRKHAGLGGRTTKLCDLRERKKTMNKQTDSQAASEPQVRRSALLAGDPIIESLKKRYFDVISKEDYPNTPKLTQEADHIEKAVREMQQKHPPTNAS